MSSQSNEATNDQTVKIDQSNETTNDQTVNIDKSVSPDWKIKNWEKKLIKQKQPLTNFKTLLPLLVAGDYKEINNLIGNDEEKLLKAIKVCNDDICFHLNFKKLAE